MNSNGSQKKKLLRPQVIFKLISKLSLGARSDIAELFQRGHFAFCCFEYFTQIHNVVLLHVESDVVYEILRFYNVI